jgi:hypothetical protein
MKRTLVILLALVAAVVGCVRTVELEPQTPDANFSPDANPEPDARPVPDAHEADAPPIDAEGGLPDAA